MNKNFRLSIPPYFAAGAGLIGLGLRIWLYAAIDEKGLLPAKHPADTMLYILTAVVLAILFAANRKRKFVFPDANVYRICTVIVNVLAALSFFLAARAVPTFKGVKLAYLAIVGCWGGALALLACAYFRFQGKAVPFCLPAVVTVALILNTVAQCQVWGTEPQLQEYFFPLLASVFVIFTAYQSTALTVRSGKPAILAFCSQGALFLCMLCLNTNRWYYYLGLGIWSASQLFSYRKEV